MAEAWYKDGLRFRCTRCGNCCTGPPGYVWINQAELANLAEFLEQTVEQVKTRYTRVVSRHRSLIEKPNGDCIFFEKEKGCTVYPVRPRQCQTWPFWHSNVITPESWKRTCSTCPGSGQGELIPVEEITRRLNVIRI